MIGLLSSLWAYFLLLLTIAADTGLLCAIHMGSNNFRLIVGEMKGGKYLQHHFTKDRLGVGDDMSATGVISLSKLQQIDQTLKKYWADCDSKGIPSWNGGGHGCVSGGKKQGRGGEDCRVSSICH